MIIDGQSYHLKDVVRLGKAYHSESPYAVTHEYNEKKTLDFLRQAMIYPTMKTVVAEYDNRVVGAAICYLQEYMWADSYRATMEFFYVEPEYRALGLAEQMLERCIEWAVKMNATEFMAGDLGLRPRLTQRFLENQGFQDPGVILRKVLNVEKVTEEA
jgi:GNAT superfamily N-acetyltransferase